ncbi:ATP-dependent helicase [Ornithinicoccus halotolerans]|uniref:ATP-dependent helicase n=1 Tax=Ornithinicoccus halotolerans TaxID=1748220 RepID=UPI00129584F4|nr:ATP-dependent DNA helicase [Ornithinicoccus halotolerans]
MSAAAPRWGAADVAAALGAPPPTPEQARVIEAPLEPVLVVAGAGSGKTETMAARVVWLVANHMVRPEEVLGLTFTRKAATELGERLARRLRTLANAGLWSPEGEQGPLAPPTVSTYHSYAGRLVGEHGLRVGIKPGSRLLSEAACWQLATEVVEGYDGDMAGIEQAAATLVQAVLSVSGELAEHLVTEDEAESFLLDLAARVENLPGRDHAKPKVVGRRTAAQLRDLARVYPLVRRYRQAKRGREALDFADQVALAARLARDVPDVGRAERQRYRAVLLDEFQDTSEAQLVLLRSLFAEDGGAVTAVGDPHQSIYGWRGASATTLARFPEAFGAVGRPAPVLPLSTSWRNDEAVLTVANAVAAPLRRGSRVPVEPLRARPGVGAGQVSAARLSTHEEEADLVARWVAERWREPAEGADSGVRSAAVLCRNRAQFDTVVAALRRYGLPVEVVGLGGLLSAPEVVDLVALLAVAQDPTRGDQLARLLAGPACRLGAADLDGLWAWARRLREEDEDRVGAAGGASPEPPVLADAVHSLPPPGWRDSRGRHVSESGRRRVAWLARVLDRVRQSAGQPLPDLVAQAERWLELDLEVASDPDTPPAWARAQLDALAEVAAQFAVSAERPTLGGFVAWLEAARAHERGLEPAEVAVSAHAVQVMTVHAAKGLEWDVVAVPGMAEGVFPAYTARSRWQEGQWQVSDPSVPGWLTGLDSLPYPLRGDAAGLPQVPWAAVRDTHTLDEALEEHRRAGGRHAVTEERRLAYVALTRARQELLLTAPVWSTGTTPRVTSRFLAELLEHPQAGPGIHRLTWAPMPDPDTDGPATNPLLERETLAPWPTDRDQARGAVTDLVAAILDDPGSATHAGEDPGRLAQQAELLLRERDRDPTAGRLPPPAQLSTSELVSMARDPELFWRRRRRPVPAPPAHRARQGTAFHAWVERHYARAALLDVHDLPGADDTGEPSAGEMRLRENFLASPWAEREPRAVEVPVETTLGGVPMRGRIDAVFPDPDGGVVIVDWKTGAPAEDGDRDHRALQLAAYRLAYARQQGLAPEQVRAVFFHAATGETVEPELPDERELETRADELLATRPGGR